MNVMYLIEYTLGTGSALGLGLYDVTDGKPMLEI